MVVETIALRRCNGRSKHRWRYMDAQLSRGAEESRSLFQNFWKLGAGRAFVKMSETCSEDRIISKMYCRQVITEDSGWCFAWLSEFVKKVLNPLQLGEDGGEGSVLSLGGASANRLLVGAFTGDEVAAEVNTKPCGGSPIIKVTGPVRI
ncbi:hypothetical protein PIB30_003911 [Stylosanthes scabra]|uniref:Uncharacterized protein n=1 Tax=Stylosanthes scabra TaxID=79078 RepID=A0ABU6U2G5_9FABA|nr:hypothetical protein [Stylosanthes scabra]